MCVLPVKDRILCFYPHWALTGGTGWLARARCLCLQPYNTEQVRLLLPVICALGCSAGTVGALKKFTGEWVDPSTASTCLSVSSSWETVINTGTPAPSVAESLL